MPGWIAVDHVALTVPDLDKAVAFYCEVIGGKELFRLGPFDAAEIPRMPDGRDWTDAHIDVAGARLTLAMLQLGPHMKLEAVRSTSAATDRCAHDATAQLRRWRTLHRIPRREHRGGDRVRQGEGPEGDGRPDAPHRGPPPPA